MSDGTGIEWAEDIRVQCQTANVPFFFKKDSVGRHCLRGRLWEQYPEATGAAVNKP